MPSPFPVRRLRLRFPLFNTCGENILPLKTEN